MALVLCIETSTERCSVAISQDGKLEGYQETTGDFDHSAQLTLLIEACLKASKREFADLEAVAVSEGPGSYTSLRVGLSTAKGFCFGLQVPLITLDSLWIIAHGAVQENIDAADAFFIPMIDARRMEVYYGVYDRMGTVIEKPQALILDETSFAAYSVQNRTLVFAGNGAKKMEPLIASSSVRFSSVVSSAKAMPLLAEAAFQQKRFSDLAYTEPVYLKPPNITIAKSRL